MLAQGAVVDIEPTRENRHNVVLTVDGRVAAELESNQHICVRSAEPESLFVRLRDRNYFYRSLLDRMEPRINRLAPRRHDFLTGFAFAFLRAFACISIIRFVGTNL